MDVWGRLEDRTRLVQASETRLPLTLCFLFRIDKHIPLTAYDLQIGEKLRP